MKNITRAKTKRKTTERKSWSQTQSSSQKGIKLPQKKIYIHNTKANELDAKRHNETELSQGQQTEATMDPFYKALSLFRLRKYDQCIEICNQLLSSNPTLQGPWELKMRAMTQRVYVDDIEAEEDAVTGSIDCPTFFRTHFFDSPLAPSHSLVPRVDVDVERRQKKRNSDCIFVYCIQFYVFTAGS